MTPIRKDEQIFSAAVTEEIQKARAKTPSDPVFENYLKELLGPNPEAPFTEQAKRLVERYVQSLLDRTNVPHVHEGKITPKDFFQHLSDYAKQLAEEENQSLPEGEKIDIDVFIGGGVVRTMLANMYKFVHERKTAQIATTPSVKDLKQAATALGDIDPEQVKRKKRMLKGTEFHLVQSVLAEKSKIPSPFVLGVGSDLDVYYEVKPKSVESHGN